MAREPYGPVRAFKLTVAYDGTAYAGWQRQPNVDTVQARIETALGEIEGRDVTLHGAGRTDAGVHALGQVASIQIRRPIEGSRLLRALNAKLPGDIRVLRVETAPDSFHARYGARRKSYRYRINHAPVANPMERRFSWHVPVSLDMAEMNRAGAVLIGSHDFAAFQTASKAAAVSSTVRTIFDLRIRPEGDGMIALDVTGDGFLRYMVRTMVGTLVEVGRDLKPADEMAGILASLARDRAGPTAPPQGLFLVSVDYLDA